MWPARRDLIIFAEHQFLAVSGFHALILKFEPRQTYSNQGEKGRSERCPKQSSHNQGIRNRADQRQFGYVAGKPDQYRQKCDERHHRIDEIDPEASIDVENRIASS